MINLVVETFFFFLLIMCSPYNRYGSHSFIQSLLNNFHKITCCCVLWWGGVSGHFAPGSVPILCHIISCFCLGHLGTKRTNSACSSCDWKKKMFISKWCSFSRNQMAHEWVSTAQMMAAKFLAWKRHECKTLSINSSFLMILILEANRNGRLIRCWPQN